MTVSDFIAKLNNCSSDATVWIDGKEQFIVVEEDIEGTKIVNVIPN